MYRWDIKLKILTIFYLPKYCIKEEYFKDWPRTRAKVVCGDISDEIFDYTDTAGIDLLVMGTHGRKGLDRIVFGSVAERVIKTASVPVLVVNPYGNITA